MKYIDYILEILNTALECNRLLCRTLRSFFRKIVTYDTLNLIILINIINHVSVGYDGSEYFSRTWHASRRSK